MCVDTASLEHFIREQVLARLETPDLFEIVERDAGDKNRIAELRQESSTSRLAGTFCLDDYTDNIITRDELKYTQDRLSARKASIDMELDKLQRAQFTSL